jgi:hypothetical protein
MNVVPPGLSASIRSKLFSSRMSPCCLSTGNGCKFKQRKCTCSCHWATDYSSLCGWSNCHNWRIVDVTCTTSLQLFGWGSTVKDLGGRKISARWRQWMPITRRDAAQPDWNDSHTEMRAILKRDRNPAWIVHSVTGLRGASWRLTWRYSDQPIQNT